MSGIGEAIAIVGFVAGLVQALDAGIRIVQQIKERRQAHRANGALPPSDQLEETLIQGKLNIEQIVQKGKRRFGDKFEEDDTAKMAIMQITIQIQNALLQRLTQARSDDGVIDFDECIDLSDQGCNDALVALQALYQRKLKDDMEHKQKRDVVQQEEEAMVEVQQPPSFETHIPKARNTDANTSKPRAPPATVPAPSPQAPSKKSRNLGFNFSRKLTIETEQDPTDSKRSNTTPVSPPTRKRSSVQPDQYKPVQHHQRPSISSDSSHSTSATTILQEPNAAAWTPSMSRTTTVASTTTSTSAIVVTTSSMAKYSGTCKYAFKAREKGCKEALMSVNSGIWGCRWIYQCKSSKCRFQCRAVEVQKTIRMDDKVYSGHGVQFRHSLLTKSHLSHDINVLEWPYACLFCLFLNHKSDVYYGADNLIRHISSHGEQSVGQNNMNMRGPLSFNDTNVETNDLFDVMLAPISSPPSPPTPPPSQPQVLEEIAGKLEAQGTNHQIKVSTRALSQADELQASADPLFNPWALK